MVDLRLGNPIFLAPYWEKMVPPLFSNTLSYQREAGTAQLIHAIRSYHAQIGNVSNLGKYEIVVGHGASQVLQAALATSPLRNNGIVYAHPPHYPKFEFFAKQASLPFTNNSYHILSHPTTEIVTYPTNPDNRTDIPTLETSYKVYDCSYLWPQYTGAYLSGNQKVVVFSLSKAIGFASLRIGWALVEDPAIARQMRAFIENQSGDVSLPSQELATAYLEHECTQLNLGLGGVAAYGLKILDNRWHTLKPLVPNSLNKSGMFLWMDGSLPPEIQGINGIHFGVDRRYNRYSIGCSDADFERLVDILIKSK